MTLLIVVVTALSALAFCLGWLASRGMLGRREMAAWQRGWDSGIAAGRRSQERRAR